jgi:hypothetical protein
LPRINTTTKIHANTVAKMNATNSRHTEANKAEMVAKNEMPFTNEKT